MLCEITIIIPSYNPGYYLIDALESVYKQTYSNWQLILIDDCSTDNSIEMAQKLLNDRRITVISNIANTGQSKAQNRAIQFVDTPYFIQLDSDDWLMPNALEILVNEFRKQPEDIALVSGNIQIVYDKNDYPSIDQEDKIICKGRLFKDKYDFLLSNMTLWPRCYRTSAINKIGGWPTDDPYEGRHAEDKRILLRLIEEYRFHWIDEVLYAHRRHRNNDTNNQDIYNELNELSVREALKRWGNKFTPVFEMNDGGWKNLTKLIPRND